MRKVWAVWNRYENSSLTDPVLTFKYFEMCKAWIERQGDPVAWIAQEVMATFAEAPSALANDRTVLDNYYPGE